MFHTLKILHVYPLLLLLIAITTNRTFATDITKDTSIQEQKGVANLVSQKNYTTIIFDVGNVLVVWEPHTLATRVRSELGIPFDDNDIIKFVKSEEFRQFDSGNISRKELLDTIPEELFANFSHDIKQKICARYLDILPYSLPPLTETVDILKALKAHGYHLYVLSNMSSECLPILREQNYFLTLFDGTVFSCEEHSGKPDATFYQVLLNRYNLDPADCLFIDDVPKNIAAAKELGIDGIIHTSSAFVKNELKYLGILD